jgi:hypothetical protein
MAPGVAAPAPLHQIEGMTELTPPLIDADPAKLPPKAA